jgi:hypothetical protein
MCDGWFLSVRSQVLFSAIGVKEPPHWDITTPASSLLLPVANGSAEFDEVKNRFCVHGFDKDIVKVERVQVCEALWERVGLEVRCVSQSECALLRRCLYVAVWELHLCPPGLISHLLAAPVGCPCCRRTVTCGLITSESGQRLRSEPGCPLGTRCGWCTAPALLHPVAFTAPVVLTSVSPWLACLDGLLTSL